MQPRRSAAHRPRMKRKQLVDVEWREDRQKEVRDALGQLLRLGVPRSTDSLSPPQGCRWPPARLPPITTSGHGSEKKIWSAFVRCLDLDWGLKPTKNFHKSVLGAPGAFPIHSFCRSAVPQCTPSTTRLEPAQVDDDTPHSHSTFSLLVPSLCCVADLSQVCEMNPVVSGWCCMLSTQPLSIDPQATCSIHHLRAKE